MSTPAVVHHLLIDVETCSKKRLMRELRGLRSTIDVQDGGVYHQDPGYSQVLVQSTRTAGEIEQMLYRSSRSDVVGVIALPAPTIH